MLKGKQHAINLVIYVEIWLVLGAIAKYLKFLGVPFEFINEVENNAVAALGTNNIGKKVGLFTAGSDIRVGCQVEDHIMLAHSLLQGVKVEKVTLNKAEVTSITVVLNEFQPPRAQVVIYGNRARFNQPVSQVAADKGGAGDEAFGLF